MRLKAVDFEVKRESCVKCGSCIRDCLMSIIEMDEYPVIREENREKCIHCGHCEAICPTASISIDGHAPDTLDPEPPVLSRAEVASLVKRRRSIREYKPEAVDEKILQEAIDIASYAPTSTNSRQISYVVLNGREKVEELIAVTADIMRKSNFLPQILREMVPGRDRIFRGAPCVLVAHAPEKIILSPTDCATVLATLELVLPSFGLGSCWAGIFTLVCGKEIPAMLPIPQGNRVYGALMIGEPAISYKRIPFRSEPEINWL